MDTLVQSVNSNQNTDTLFTSKTTETTENVDDSDTFAMYLFTNGAEEIFGGPEGLDAAMRIAENLKKYNLNITDVETKPNAPEKNEEIEDIISKPDISDSPEISEVEELYSEIEEIAPFTFEEEKAKEAEFSDMYATSTAVTTYPFTESDKETLSYEEYVEKTEEHLTELEQNSDNILVSVGPGELPLLMNEILHASEENESLNGEILADALTKFQATHNNSDKSDRFYINPTSLTVTGVYKYERTVPNNEWRALFDDDSALLSAANDLQSFIKFTFGGVQGDSEKIQEFLNHLKNKQAYADFERFILNSTNSAEDIDLIKQMIISNLIAAGVIGIASNDELSKQNILEDVPETEFDGNIEDSILGNESEENNSGSLFENGFGENHIELALQREFAKLLAGINSTSDDTLRV